MTPDTGPEVGPASTEHVLEPALARLPGHLLWRAAARVDSALSASLPPGSDVHTYSALVALDGVTLSQQELADRIGVSRTTMVRVASALTADGLVERVRNPDDRRSYALTRTAAGAAAARDWAHLAGEIEDRLVGDLTPAEVADLQSLMARLAADDLHERTPAELRRSIGFLVVQVHARKHRDFTELFEPLGIIPREFGTMTALRAVGPVSQSELARTLGVSGATVVQIVDGLERGGLAERRSDPADRRTHLVALTDRGGDVADRAGEVSAQHVPVLLAALDAAESERLVDLLRRIVTAR